MRAIEAHDLELYAINTGAFYQKHKALVGCPRDAWANHLRDHVLPRYHREIEPVTYDWQTIANVATNLKNYYETHAREGLDRIDRDSLDTRCAERDKRIGPRVGDWVQMLDGTVRRFTYNWGDGLQTTYRWKSSGNVETGRFCLDKSGAVSFSGSLDNSIPTERLVDTGEIRLGYVWFFHHDEHKAHNGITVAIDCRVFKEIAA